MANYTVKIVNYDSGLSSALLGAGKREADARRGELKKREDGDSSEHGEQRTDGRIVAATRVSGGGREEEEDGTRRA